MRARAMLGARRREHRAGGARRGAVRVPAQPAAALAVLRRAALAALEKGEVMLATSQLETALAHHEQCIEAAQILEHVRKHGAAPSRSRRVTRDGCSSR